MTVLPSADGTRGNHSVLNPALRHVNSTHSPGTALSMTRSAEIMRRILREVAEREVESLENTSTLADPDVVE